MNKQSHLKWFTPEKESIKLNNYFARQGYTVSESKELCNWFIERIDNTQQITRIKEK